MTGEIIWSCSHCFFSGRITDVPVETSSGQVAACAMHEHAKRHSTCALVHGALGVVYTFKIPDITEQTEHA